MYTKVQVKSLSNLREGNMEDYLRKILDSLGVAFNPYEELIKTVQGINRTQFVLTRLQSLLHEEDDVYIMIKSKEGELILTDPIEPMNELINSMIDVYKEYLQETVSHGLYTIDQLRSKN